MNNIRLAHLFDLLILELELLGDRFQRLSVVHLADLRSKQMWKKVL